MNIDKVSLRAKQLAEQFGIEFKVPDIKAAQEHAQRKIHKLKEYTSNKEKYDEAIAHIVESFSKDDILAFLDSVAVSKNPK
ncbi:hypothetical protein [Escherichia phage vB_EcoM_JNE01]|nr:hypothetical protein [Escherichia phage vB_EcoM_JNE01]